MSKIIVDYIEPNSGQDVQINGNLIVTGNVNMSGNTSGDCIQDLWVQHLYGCDGLLNVTGDLNVIGSVSASTLYGNGSYITQDISDITLDGTDSSNTTQYLNYGINLIVSGDVSNFVARLPQTPVKGRTVTVINNSGISMILYPSMNGGIINGVVNGAYSIPSDNQAYTFTCYENPAPGSWSAPVVASTGQYDSGEITFDLTGADWFTDVISASDPTRWTQAGAFAGSTGWAYDGLNNPYYFFSAGNSVAWKPPVPWSYITKLTVYTNMTTLTQQTAGISFGRFLNYYIPGSTLSTDFLSATNAQGGNFGDPAYLGLTSKLSGTPVTTGTTTGPTSGFTAHVGEPGTAWGELVYNAGGGQPNDIGDKFIQTAQFDFGYGPTLADQWSSTYINVCFQPRFQGNGIKYRFLIDYIL
jgi:hypothetical protein